MESGEFIEVEGGCDLKGQRQTTVGRQILYGQISFNRVSTDYNSRTKMSLNYSVM